MQGALASPSVVRFKWRSLTNVAAAQADAEVLFRCLVYIGCGGESVREHGRKASSAVEDQEQQEQEARRNASVWCTNTHSFRATKLVSRM